VPPRLHHPFTAPRWVAEEGFAGFGALEPEVGVVVPGEADAAVDLDGVDCGLQIGLGRAGLGQRSERRQLGEHEGRQAALDQHYQYGPPANWETDFISAYASTHPWEDWAESWAHVLHMIDALETAESVGVSIKPPRPDEPALAVGAPNFNAGSAAFDEMLRAWLALTYALNNFTRGLGLADSYPFVLSARVVEKLRFVYDTINQSVTAAAQDSVAPGRG